MMRFPLTDLLDEQECYDYLLRVLHPDGLQCPNRHPLPADQSSHDRHRAPVQDYRCRTCGGVFNLFTGTVWSGTHYGCVTIVLLLRGFAQGTPTLQLADELELDYETVLNRRHDLQQLALDHKPTAPLTDAITEADEMRLRETPAKRAKHTTIQPTRRATALIIDVGWGLWTTTDRPCWVWSGAPRATSV
jgi:transposase-like protein